MDFFDRFLRSENHAVRDAARNGRLHAFFERLLETGDPAAAADELPKPPGYYYLDRDFCAAVEKTLAAFHAPGVLHALFVAAKEGNAHALKAALEKIADFKSNGLNESFVASDDGGVPPAPTICVVAAGGDDGAAKEGV